MLICYHLYFKRIHIRVYLITEAWSIFGGPQKLVIVVAYKDEVRDSFYIFNHFAFLVIFVSFVYTYSS
jgi:hypothetical protein